MVISFEVLIHKSLKNLKWVFRAGASNSKGYDPKNFKPDLYDPRQKTCYKLGQLTFRDDSRSFSLRDKAKISKFLKNFKILSF